VFQLARQHQRRIENSNPTAVRTVDYAPASPGKQALTDQQHGGSLGAPDHYNRAIDTTLRELDAIRTTALPNLVAIRRKTDRAPLTKQIELAKAAMQVRHMILCANAHVYALEKAATHDDPMVSFLRGLIENVVLCVPISDFALEAATEKFRKDFGFDPEVLPGHLAFENKTNFQPSRRQSDRFHSVELGSRVVMMTSPSIRDHWAGWISARRSACRTSLCPSTSKRGEEAIEQTNGRSCTAH
jgi:hypothetical protein